MAVDGRAGALAWTIAVALAGCLDGPASDGSSSSSSSGETTSAASSSIDPGYTSIVTSTASPASTTVLDTTTIPPPPSCSDGQQNGDETDLDCGGSCLGCPEGQACGGPADCLSALCGAGVCQPQECASDDDCGALDGPCRRGVCEPESHTCVTAPDQDGQPCDDGDLCTVGDACTAGACGKGTPPDCSEFDSACTVGQCDPESGSCGAVDLRDGTDCDDGDGCTFNEACTQGACVAPTGEGALYHTDFSAVSDWNLQAPWQIGASFTSPMGVGGADPAFDHTDTEDNGVAGLAIGGLDPMPSHGFLCLTSPAIDTTQIQGTLWLTYWRHLHTATTPGVTNRIEVWNGATWKLIQTGYGAVIDDPDWTLQKLNLTGNSAVDFKIRFCVSRTMGSPDFAGWSIDDLTLAPAACTP